MTWGSRQRRAGSCLLRQSIADADAFHAFYVTYVERLIVYLARRTVDPDVTADLAAETFAMALERRAQFRGTTSAEEQGWLFAIARRELYAYGQRGEVERGALARVGLESPSSTLTDLEWVERQADLPKLRASVVAAIASLPEDQAAAITARILEGRSYPEIAAETGFAEQVIRARVSRGLRALRPVLEEYRLQDVA